MNGFSLPRPPNFLSRLPGSAPIMKEIEGLRFIAISAVVLFHLRCYVGMKAHDLLPDLSENWFARLLMFGDSGVPLFFVISGFVLSIPFVRHYRRGSPKTSLKNFYFRRVTRLEPPYVAMLLLFALALRLTKGVAFGEVLPGLLASLFYVHGVAFHAPSAINVVCWSLEIEIQFYLLMPLFGHVFAVENARVRRLLLLGFVVAAQPATRLIFSEFSGNTWSHLTLLGHYQYFAAGMLLADLVIGAPKDGSPSRGDLLAFVGFAAIVGFRILDASTSTSPISPTVFRSMISSLSPLAILVAYRGVLMGGYIARILRAPWLVTIGGMCYSVYLLHYPIISFAGRFSAHLFVPRSFLVNYLLQALLVIPVVFAISALFFSLIERPCMDRSWPKNLWRWCLTRLNGFQSSRAVE